MGSGRQSTIAARQFLPGAAPVIVMQAGMEPAAPPNERNGAPPDRRFGRIVSAELFLSPCEWRGVPDWIAAALGASP
jgi:hypothetical protein